MFISILLIRSGTGNSMSSGSNIRRRESSVVPPSAHREGQQYKWQLQKEKTETFEVPELPDQSSKLSGC